MYRGERVLGSTQSARAPCQGDGSVRPDEVERIDGNTPVRGEPVEVRLGHAPRRAPAADRLTDVDRVARRDEHAAQMEIPGHEPRTVVDEDSGPAVVEISDQ